MPHLGINIDHIATLRNARGESYPNPVEAACVAERAGADNITIHLREDRRHIKDKDAFLIKEAITIPLNFEMAATEEMVAIACQLKPEAACIVPERRQEITTEGGLDVDAMQKTLIPMLRPLQDAGIKLSLFIEADAKQLDAASAIGADIVELHTGSYAVTKDKEKEREKIKKAAIYGTNLGLEIHAGHGLTLDNVAPIATIDQIITLNIGHAIIADAIFYGLEKSVKRMKRVVK